MRRAVPDSVRPLLLGIDLGSSGVKAVLLDPQEGIIATKSDGVALYSDHPGWAEADPNDWWAAVCVLVPQLIHAAGVSAADISAVAVAGMVPAVRRPRVEGDPRPARVTRRPRPPAAYRLDPLPAVGRAHGVVARAQRT
jgi:hypothetical protein